MTIGSHCSLWEQRNVLVFNDRLHILEVGQNLDPSRRRFDCNGPQRTHVVIESSTAPFRQDLVHIDQDRTARYAKSADCRSSPTEIMTVRGAALFACLE